MADTTSVTIDPITKQPVTKVTPGWIKDIFGSGADKFKTFFDSNTTGSTDYGGGGYDYNSSVVNPVTNSSGYTTGTGTENYNSEY
jgi:hypothetical protein